MDNRRYMTALLLILLLLLSNPAFPLLFLSGAILGPIVKECWRIKSKELLLRLFSEAEQHCFLARYEESLEYVCTPSPSLSSDLSPSIPPTLPSSLPPRSNITIRSLMMKYQKVSLNISIVMHKANQNIQFTYH